MCVQVFVFLLSPVITAQAAASLAFCGTLHFCDILGLMDIKHPPKVEMCFLSALYTLMRCNNN